MSTVTQNGDSRVDALMANRAKRNGKGSVANQTSYPGELPSDPDSGPGETTLDVQASGPGETTLDVQASPIVNPPVVTMSKDALLKAYEESFDRSVKSIGAILDNTALEVYCAVGADCFDTIFRAKNMFDADTQERLGKDAKSTWKSDDFDDQCHRLSTRCRVLFPHLFRPSKEESDKAEASGKKRDPVRVSDYILAHMTVAAIKPLTGDCVDNLSYFLIVNYVARKVVSFSRTDLTCTIRADWSEFVRLNIPRVASGSILVRDFLALMEQHQERLDQSEKDKRNAGKTPEQVAQAEATEAVKKASREKKSKEKKTRTSLENALTDAMSGILDPDDISKIIRDASQTANVALPVSALNPATISADDILSTLQALFLLKRFDVIRAICAACADMVPMLDRFDPPKPLAVADAG